MPTWNGLTGLKAEPTEAAPMLIATAVIFIPARKRGGLEARHLLIGGLFYLAYLVFVIALIAGMF